MRDAPSAPRRRSWPWPLIRRGGQAGGLGGGGARLRSAIGFALLVFSSPAVFLLGGYLIGRLLGLGDGGSIGMAAAGLVLGFVPAVLINRTITRRKTPEFTVLGYLHSV